MLAAARVGNDRKFSRYSEFLYGKPSVENTAYIVAGLKNRFGKTVGGTSMKQAGRARLLERMVTKVPVEDFDASILPTGQKIGGEVEDAVVLSIYCQIVKSVLL